MNPIDRRVPTWTVLELAALTLGACAHDPSSEVRAAQTSLSSAQQSAREEMDALDKKQAEERAKANAQSQSAIAEAEQRRADAAKAFDNAKSETTQNATGALENLDAQAGDYRLKSSNLTDDGKAQFQSLWDRYRAQRKDVQGQLQNLGTAGPNTWDTAKDNVSDSLQGLSETVRRMGRLF